MIQTASPYQGFNPEYQANNCRIISTLNLTLDQLPRKSDRNSSDY
ncbi:MAG: hypothetical protein RSE13_06045 [Planktothrix sp. GU0601_MAG3]|nr:MAG: hypothetical protein RSE13_06045 [Planktothrix sp. GU0601_MAG3]